LGFRKKESMGRLGTWLNKQRIVIQKIYNKLFKNIKRIHYNSYGTYGISNAKIVIVEYINIFYNCRGLHSVLMSQIEYKRSDIKS
jgi:hypothetical protein